MWHFIVAGIVSLILVAVAAFVAYARWEYGSLEKMGIPVVKPGWVLGSQPNMHKLILQDEDCRNAQTLGKTWGVS